MWTVTTIYLTYDLVHLTQNTIKSKETDTHREISPIILKFHTEWTLLRLGYIRGLLSYQLLSML